MGDTVQVQRFRPLVGMVTAKMLLDCSEDAVLAMIESGKLSWAWDIKHPDAKRREVRVWIWSIAERLGQAPRTAATDQEVIWSLLPHGRHVLRSTELQRMFTASQCHVQALITCGALQGVKKAKPGPQGFALVTRASVLEFLEQRRML